MAIVSLAELSPSTRADFLRLGCQVLLRPTPAQLFHLSVENERRLSRGMKLIFRTNLPPVVVYQGLVAELDLRTRTRRLLQILFSENTEFDPWELAAKMGCDRLQVKVYVEGGWLTFDFCLRRQEAAAPRFAVFEAWAPRTSAVFIGHIHAAGLRDSCSECRTDSAVITAPDTCTLSPPVAGGDVLCSVPDRIETCSLR
jgi:hypothetical protein